MENFAPLAGFFDAIADDSRISTAHVSLYVALLNEWNMKGGLNPFAIDRDAIMKKAKISARRTYHRCMNNLQDYGYIKYLPASNSFTKSMVYLKRVEALLQTLARIDSN